MTDEPAIRRKFQYTDLSGNNNKWWLVEWWSDGRYLATYGRVGAAPQKDEKTGVSEYSVDKKIREKIDKGYEEVDLHRPTVVSTTITGNADPKVEQLAAWIAQEAGEKISQYLATNVDALSKRQIELGRGILDLIVHNRNLAHLPKDVERYYNTIPTQLPRKIDVDELVREFDVAEQHNRLDQLEAAIASYVVTSQGGSKLSSLGAELTLLDQSRNAYQQIYDYITRTGKGSGYRIQDIFTVKIDPERAAWEAETTGKHNIQSLFHGTYNPNVRHILRTGLIIPRSAFNGSRFGRGIYFANKALRSINYCDSSRNIPRMLFVVDVALGTPKKLDGDDSSITRAPHGYDSVWGIKSYSGMDEFIVYRPSQQTIRAIVTLV